MTFTGSRLRRIGLADLASAAAMLACSIVLHGYDAARPDVAQVDAIFSKWTSRTPGCGVGVSSGGRIVLEKAYGMADLEHDVRNTPDTIFEAGSVSKQFTAAAVLLLAREGKLSLDDQASKYIPELPDYGHSLTIRHLLQHTSGLRDWGEVEIVAGWPRTTRAYTQAHVLDIVSRQKSLNFVPGTKWSYSNTGYNLVAIIVTRVSGMPFSEFCRTRIFQPLGMTHTSWRDDFRRIVKKRAIAYDETKDGFRQNMPFEDVHGNTGLLTTVGDLLRWNENAVTQKVGDAELLREELTPGHLNDGTLHDYAMGLYIRNYMGLLPEVSHGGATAGYRAFLARYPDQHLSVAVLCNVSTGTPQLYALDAVRLYFSESLQAKMKTALAGRNLIANEDQATTRSINAHEGLFRNTSTGVPLVLIADKLSLKPGGSSDPSSLLHPIDSTTYQPLDGSKTYSFDVEGVTLRVKNDNGTTDVYERVEIATPTPDELRSLAGRYVSDEAEVELDVEADGTDLKIKRRPNTTLALKPVYKDAFSAQSLGLVRFRRDADNRVTALSVTLDRLWDLRFEKK
jgi:CubicO group peptidase (beta-lactamase class C family)